MAIHAKGLGLKVGFEAQDGDWDVEFIKNYDIDLTVLFRNTYQAFSTNCNVLGIGPYCNVDLAGREMEFVNRITQLVQAVSDGSISSDSISVIVYNAALSDFEIVKEVSNKFGANGIWLTDNSHYDSSKPDYWDDLLIQVTAPAGRSTNCGCVDNDECNDGSDSCHANAQCSNQDGGYSCQCGNGFTGDGIDCILIDICSNGSHDCDINAECSMSDQGASCNCNPGFDGDGFTCVDINECETGLHNCHLNALCTNTPGGFVCNWMDSF